jgi:ribonuclease I
MFKLSLVALAGVLASNNLFAVDLTPQDAQNTYNNYTQYVFSVSWQPGFCLTKINNPPIECKNQTQKINRQDHLTIHGLWPGLPYSFSEKMQDENIYAKLTRWKKHGCAADPVHASDPTQGRVPYECGAAAKNNPQLEKKLADYMPGVNPSSCLDLHEYKKHGSCFNFDPGVYFSKMIDLLQQIRSSQFGDYIGHNYGKAIKKYDLREKLDQSYGFQARNSTIFSCVKQGGDYFFGGNPVHYK